MIENETASNETLEQPQDTQVNEASTEEAQNVVNETPRTDATPQERTFTQQQVNKMMRSRLDRYGTSFFNRYGVKDRDGLDGLIGKAQSYDIMKERYEASKTKISDLQERLAFLSNGINPDREDDIRAYFKGKGIEFSDEALVKELEKHPEWRKVVESDATPKTTIDVLGVEHRNKFIPETEAEKQQRIFGV